MIGAAWTAPYGGELHPKLQPAIAGFAFEANGTSSKGQPYRDPCQESEPAWRDRFVVVAAVGGRLHPPGLGAVPHGDGFMQFGANVVQADAVLDRKSVV